MVYKRQIVEAYESDIDSYLEGSNGWVKEYTQPYLDKVVSNTISLPIKRGVDLGSGGGRDSLYLKSRGLEPLCVDLSPIMVERCHRVGLNASIGDIEEIKFPAQSFGWAWSFVSMCHVPKSKWPTLLEKINNWLIPGGIFCTTVPEGDYQGTWDQDVWRDSRGPYCLFQEDEFKKLISGHFPNAEFEQFKDRHDTKRFVALCTR